MTIDETISLAKRHHLAGELALAAPLYRQVLDVDPNHSKALFFSGMLAAQQGRHQDAADLIAAAIAVDPTVGAYHLSLGQSLLALKRFDEAIAAYRKAIALQPNLPEAFFGLGVAHQSLHQFNDAITAYQRAIAVKPDYVEAHNNLAVLLLAQRQFDLAIPALHQALKLQPDFAPAWYNLGNALQATSQFNEAIAAYRKAVALQPNYSQAHCNLGNALQTTNDLRAAADAYRQALLHRPDFVDALSNLGSVLRRMGDLDQAAIVYREALKIRPDFSIAHCNLGNVLKDSGDLDSAIAAYRTALQCDSKDDITHSNLIYTLSYHPDYDSPAILQEHLNWNRLHATPLADEMLPHGNDANPHRRLRIGYVAPHFREHCQSLFTIPLLAHHDHEQFEIFCYSSVAQPDAITQRIAGHADVFRNVSTLTDAELTKIVREDRIDILVDLTMHMSDGRPLLFARKPAPIQIAWLAYPGTTGISAIDYRLSDPHLDPPGESENFYSEKTIRLPDTFWCYDPLSDEPISELSATANGHITFGCLNNFCKVTAPTISLWSQTLKAVTNSRLLILCPLGEHRQRLLDQFQHHGIDPRRIELIEFQPRRQYLQLYHRIDIGLDTIPYNGHTTSLDSLWMGVPVVSRLGRTVVGRAGWSQLTNLNLRELAADSDEQFVRIVTGLASDLPRLSLLRRALRKRMQQSPLMNATKFALDIESVYRQAWQQYCAT